MGTDILYCDRNYGLGRDPLVYESSLLKQYKIQSLVNSVNPMVARLHFSPNLPSSISLKDDEGNTTTLFKAGPVSHSELVVNDKDGHLQRAQSSHKLVIKVHFGNDKNEFEAKIVDVTKVIDFKNSHLCGEMTKIGKLCRNKTKHESKKCHYHRVQSNRDKS